MPAHQVLEADREADFAAITRNHLALLDQDAAIKARFLSEPDWLNLYGLPIRYEEREIDGQAGAVQMLRAQRTVFVVWNVPAPGTTVGRVNLQNVPDKVKRFSNAIIPDGAKAPVTSDAVADLPSFALPEPTPAPSPVPTPIPVSVVDGAIGGIAWVQDGLSHGEDRSVQQLRELARISPNTFWSLVRNPGIHTTSAYSEQRVPTNAVRELIVRFVTIARKSPTAAATVAAMPFFHTFDGLDLLPLWTLETILWFAPDELESTVSYLESIGGLTDAQRLSLPLLHLRQRHPEAARAIEALPWIQDGIAPPALDRGGTPVEFLHEPGMLIDMMEWQLRGFRGHLATLVGRPWFQDGLDRRERFVVNKMMSEFTFSDSQASLQILKMPFLKTIGEGDLFIVDLLYAAAFDDELRSLLSQPALQDGIADGQVPVVALEYLGLRDANAAATIRALPWVGDGVAVSEVDPLLALQRLAMESPLVLDAIIGKSWIPDGIDTRELSIIDHFTNLGNR